MFCISVISLASFYGRNSGTNASNTTVDDEETITDGDDSCLRLKAEEEDGGKGGAGEGTERF